MTTTTRLIGFTRLLVAAWVSIACGESDCQKTLTCGSVVDITHGNDKDAGDDGSSSQDVDGSISHSPPVCSPTPTQGCVLADQSAIYVNPSAAVNGDGSQTSPVRTIREGLGLARQTASARVILCNGIYDEPVDLAARDTIGALLGGFNCDGWVYNPSGETLVRPAESGFALRVNGLAGSLVVADITFEAAAASEPGASSVAAFIENSIDVQLRRVQLVAHDGQAGENGAAEPYVAGKAWPPTESLNGNWAKAGTNDASVYVGADATEVTCPGGETTRGGLGGSNPELEGGESGLPAAIGGQASPANPMCAPAGCTAVPARCQCEPMAMTHGLDADPTPQANGALSSGTIDMTGWVPSSGVDGAIGHPGGGGAGGNGAWAACDAFRIFWYGGGGGAAGGCGGNGGTAGRGGGGSIALLILDSQVALARSMLIAGNAGDGGDGAAGQEGQAGGTGGGIDTSSGVDQAVPCSGGNGGHGGKGGAGGGGAGGISTAIAWAGNEPAIDAATTLAFGKAGARGVGGAPGSNDGIVGIAENVFQIKGD